MPFDVSWGIQNVPDRSTKMTQDMQQTRVQSGPFHSISDTTRPCEKAAESGPSSKQSVAFGKEFITK